MPTPLSLPPASAASSRPTPGPSAWQWPSTACSGRRSGTCRAGTTDLCAAFEPAPGPPPRGRRARAGCGLRARRRRGASAGRGRVGPARHADDTVEALLQVRQVAAQEVSVAGCSSSRGDFPLSAVLGERRDQWWISEWQDGTWEASAQGTLRTLDRADMQEFAIVPPLQTTGVRLVCTRSAVADEGGGFMSDCIGLFHVRFA
ncbi:unnamed protein product [Prorocentrum cordatum]|uniref:Uncharacterized protein n=1 Tax=Prorocentrum cordatum TaxID=2364126 RepID=A0ABN9W1Y3_9DINO|nr:unnamed protein product [Polarella glacialis]